MKSPSTTKKSLPRVCWVLYILAAASALLYAVFLLSPSFSDWFNRYVSTIGRRTLAYLTSWIPFSTAELLLILIPFFIVLLVWIGAKKYCDSNRSMLVYIGMMLSVVSVIWVLFVWNFAAGYFGTTLDKKLDLAREKSSAEELYETAELLIDELEQLSDEIVFLEDGFSMMPYSYNEMNQKLLAAYEDFCEEQDFIDHFTSRIKPVVLSEPMTYTHIAGVYSFFTGEANLNVNFPEYTLPYTAAHELAHQRGIAREDEANFIAFLICIRSDDPYIRYSGYLNLYEYVVSALSSASPALYAQAARHLPSDMRAEQRAYARFFEKYRENVAADISETTNNLYLQSQGAAEGTRSYNLVVDLAVAYYRPQFHALDTPNEDAA